MRTDLKIAIALALLTGLTVGIFLGRALEGEPVVPKAISPPSDTESRRQINGVPVGYERTEEGAVAAASAFSLLTAGDELSDPEALSLAMETIATDEWKAEALTQAREGYEFIVQRYGDDVDISGSVLRYDLEEFTPERAVVRLWSVSVVAGSARPNVEEFWGIATIDLAWSDGDWRVASSETTQGPAPVDLSVNTPQQSARSVMEEFDEFAGAPTP